MRKRAKATFRNLLIIVTLIFIGWALGGYDDSGTTDYSGIPSVSDGDSLTFDGLQIRLAGIDAPELGQPCNRRGQNYDCGREAQRQLSKLIGAQFVICETEETDRYGRSVAQCYAKGINLNKAMVEAGWALSYLDYDTPYLREEAAAKQHKRGLWEGTFQEPHEYRQDNRIDLNF
ncbi:MAG: thermonuclease family protein [Rickettsiales bacterium]|nr:thermonuclease family protein [Rickettsiales bacterium]